MTNLFSSFSYDEPGIFIPPYNNRRFWNTTVKRAATSIYNSKYRNASNTVYSFMSGENRPARNITVSSSNGEQQGFIGKLFIVLGWIILIKMTLQAIPVWVSWLS